MGGQPRTRAAHPHVCGEHSSTQRTATRSPGSSPRVWGAPVRSLGCRSSSGLIPTCVGSTPLILITQFDIAAHPHVCGEHPNSHICPLVPSGSSPRVWGAHHLARRWLPVSRLIPTCVGSTRAVVLLWPLFPAHPHVCGEHECGGRWWEAHSGSSPRVWGAHLEKLGGAIETRLIPTCVGSTCAAC